MIVNKNRVPCKYRSCLVQQAKSLRMHCSSFCIPKNIPSKPLGEDAHFTCNEKNSFGVADGFGGWALEGIDSGKYARFLMKNSIDALIAGEPERAVDPKRVLEEAYLNTQAKGSSTACIVTLRDNKLVAANVGDSGFMLFRDNRYIYRSPTQQRGFNRPYKLGKDESCDAPSVAEVIEVPVELGDVVIGGTNGMLDNMRPDEIEEILRKTRGSAVRPGQLASSIAERAECNSRDKSYFSPFEIAARLSGRAHSGGKVDDITVVVGMIEA